MATTPFLPGASAAGDQKQRGQDDGVSPAKNGGSPASRKQRGRKGGPKSQGPNKTPQRGMGVAQLERLLSEQWKKHASGDEGASAAAAAASSSVLLPLLPDHRLQTLPPSFHDPLAGTPILYPTRSQQVGAYSPIAAGSSAAVSHGFTNQFRWNNHQPTRFGDGSGSFQPVFGFSSAAAAAMPDQSAAVPYNPSCNCTGFFKKKRTETHDPPEKTPVTGYFHCHGPTYAPPNQFGTTFDDQVAAYRNILESSVLFGRKMCTEYEFFPQKLNQDHHHHITDPNQDHHHGEAKPNIIDLSLRL